MATQRIKYPRTPHLPWSPGATADDLVREVPPAFVGARVVVTEKLDGENTTLYPDFLHARSPNGRSHPSRDWIKRKHGETAHRIPSGWRVCGENLYAQHSIRYDALSSYFFVFSIWDETNTCLAWDETVEWAALLDLDVVPVLLDGLYNEDEVRSLKLNLETQEGYVVRTAARFAHPDFGKHIAKWVRANHVTTDQHWMHAAVVPNGLAKK